jgi:hypothetical protein
MLGFYGETIRNDLGSDPTLKLLSQDADPLPLAIP